MCDGIGFSALPEEVLTVIVGFCQELMVWRLMAVSRKVRRAVEPMLGRFLAERELVVHPGLLEHLPLRSVEDEVEVVDAERTSKLLKSFKRFDKHLTANPRSLIALKRLTIECRWDEDDHASWYLLDRFPELEQLTITFVVRPQDGPGQIDLLKLSDLTLYSTGAPIWQLLGFLETAKEVRSLKVLSGYRNPIIPDPLSIPIVLEHDFSPLLQKLQRVYLAGHLESLVNITRVFSTLPALEYVTLDPSGDTYSEEQLGNILRSIRKGGTVHSLALFGPAALDFMAEAHDPSQHGCLNGIRHLVLDETGDQGYTMMVPPENYNPKPDMNSLERIPYARYPNLSPIQPLCPGVLYVHEELQEFFDTYPTLRSVMFLEGYPPDHFAVDHTVLGPDVLYLVTRPEGGGPMRAIGPLVPS